MVLDVLTPFLFITVQTLMQVPSSAMLSTLNNYFLRSKFYRGSPKYNLKWNSRIDPTKLRLTPTPFQHLDKLPCRRNVLTYSQGVPVWSCDWLPATTSGQRRQRPQRMPHSKPMVDVTIQAFHSLSAFTPPPEPNCWGNHVTRLKRPDNNYKDLPSTGWLEG